MDRDLRFALVEEEGKRKLGIVLVLTWFFNAFK